MWRYALLGTALFVTATNGTPNNAKRYDNSSLPVVSNFPSTVDVASYSDSITSIESHGSIYNPTSSGPPDSQAADKASPSYNAPMSTVETQPLDASDLSSLDASSDTSFGESFVSVTTSLSTPTTPGSISSSTVNSHLPSREPYPYKNGTKTSSAGTDSVMTVFRGQCTGCALGALNPVTTSYESEIFGNWTSLVVTETILTEFITYLNNATVDTVVTQSKTVNQTKTLNGITETAAEFNIYLPSPGVDLTLDVGPTYVLYTNLFGGLDTAVPPNATARNNATHSDLVPTPASSTCQPRVSSITGWIPSQTDDWNLFIQTFTNGSTPEPTPYNSPVPIPDKLQDFLAQDPDLQMHFQGADINTCTPIGIGDMLIGDPSRTFHPTSTTAGVPEEAPQPTATTMSAPAMTMSPVPTFSSPAGTNTFLSTTFESTSKHITKLGCLRCDTNQGDLPQTKQDPTSNNINDDPKPPTTPNPKNDDTPMSKDDSKNNNNNNNNNNQKTDGNPHNEPQNTQQNAPSPKPDIKTTPSIPDFISSVVSDNPDLTRRPSQQPASPGQTITIGNSVVTVGPQQTPSPTMVIIGTQTVTLGQTTTINGVQVIVPANGGGSKIVVGDQTINVGPQMTQGPLPILTVGHYTITANSQGQFVVGTQTLRRGGAMVVVDDNTLTLGPNGKIAIWNGATQTLITMTGQPAATFDGELVTAELIGGTTAFVVGDKTLRPGSAITVDGKTYSLPLGFQGSSIVVDGQTQPLSAPLDGKGATAVVAHGTTAFIFGPGQTLTPGAVVTISGTTFSLPASASGSVIVINGVTSTFGSGSDLGPITAAPPIVVDGKTITATTRDGTVEYILDSATTLLPGGQVIIDGTTYSLAPGGTALVINGKTSSLSTPVSNSATTTSNSDTTSERGAGDFIASGIGESSKSKGAGIRIHGGGADKWVENAMIGLAGWLLWLV